LKLRKFCQKLCEIFNEEERKGSRLETNNKYDLKVGKISDDPRKDKSISFSSGVANFCYKTIPLRIGEFSLGV
jgi:hypothetical protein